jgi:hypothetical protein
VTAEKGPRVTVEKVSRQREAGRRAATSHPWSTSPSSPTTPAASPRLSVPSPCIEGRIRHDARHVRPRGQGGPSCEAEHRRAAKARQPTAPPSEPRGAARDRDRSKRQGSRVHQKPPYTTPRGAARYLVARAQIFIGRRAGVPLASATRGAAAGNVRWRFVARTDDDAEAAIMGSVPAVPAQCAGVPLRGDALSSHARRAGLGRAFARPAPHPTSNSNFRRLPAWFRSFAPCPRQRRDARRMEAELGAGLSPVLPAEGAPRRAATNTQVLDLLWGFVGTQTASRP